MGLAPSTARSGDLICVLFGGQIPFRVKGAYFELIEETYIHGITGGEAMQAFENGDYKQWGFSFR